LNRSQKKTKGETSFAYGVLTAPEMANGQIANGKRADGKWVETTEIWQFVKDNQWAKYRVLCHSKPGSTA
jgi:hypothetical protein